MRSSSAASVLSLPSPPPAGLEGMQVTMRDARRESAKAAAASASAAVKYCSY